ncbi:MAG TPA: GIY-YIG nuclease family protein [Candidatus Paceibacterota bacterium]
MYKVYVLENRNDKSWYIGCTEDLERRLAEHNSGI